MSTLQLNVEQMSGSSGDGSGQLGKQRAKHSVLLMAVSYLLETGTLEPHGLQKFIKSTSSVGEVKKRGWL